MLVSKADYLPDVGILTVANSCPAVFRFGDRRSHQVAWWQRYVATSYLRSTHASPRVDVFDFLAMCRYSFHSSRKHSCKTGYGYHDVAESSAAVSHAPMQYSQSLVHEGCKEMRRKLTRFKLAASLKLRISQFRRPGTLDENRRTKGRMAIMSRIKRPDGFYR